LRIYSEVGQGTTLGIYLTRYYGAIEDETVDGRIADLLRFEQSETVLIVNDKPTVRMLIADILEDLGDSAIEAGDSATIPKERQSDVRVELLTTVVGLPSGMNGRQMAEAARSHRSQQIHHIGRKSLVLRATCERTFSASAKGH